MDKAIAGPLAGKKLKKLASTRTGWKTRRNKHPSTVVLSTDTGYSRNYSVDPYEGYYRNLGIWFPVGDVRKDLSPKEMVIGIEIKGKAKAYPISELRKRPGILEEEVGGEPVQIEVSPDSEIVGVRDHMGKSIPAIFSYWFAWQAFHPKTAVYKGDDKFLVAHVLKRFSWVMRSWPDFLSLAEKNCSPF